MPVHRFTSLLIYLTAVIITTKDIFSKTWGRREYESVENTLSYSQSFMRLYAKQMKFTPA
jgi:hypothetical protein